MHKYLVMTAIAAAIIPISATMSNRADAMAISAPARTVNAIADVGLVEQVRWVCDPYRCWWQPNYYWQSDRDEDRHERLERYEDHRERGDRYEDRRERRDRAEDHREHWDR
jgi:hypothetical protein